MLHDSSPTGKASLLAEQLAAQAGRFKVRAHQQKATEAVVVDPDTLEPSHGGSSADGMGGGAGGRRMGAKETSWTLHDSSATVAMTLDVIKYASRASVVVVVSARAELAETLQHLVEGGGEEEDAQEGGGPTVSTTGGSSIGSTSPPPAVYVCALGREVAGTALERWLLKPSAQQQRQQSQSAPRPVTLERVLASAAEALWTRGRQNRRTAGLCPKGTACSHLRGTSGEAGGSSCCGVGGQGVGGNSSPRPFTAHKITHLCQYLHPCGQGQACAAVGPLHRLAFIHGGVGGGAGSSSTNASSSRSTLPLLAPTGSTGNRAQQLATSATLHNRLPLSLHHHAAAPNVPSRLAAPAPSRPAAATVVSRSPPLDVPAPRPTKPTGSGSLLAELALEGGETGAGPEAKAGFCMSPLSKAARQASLWWYEAHRAQQRAGAGAGAGGEYEEGDGHQQEWGDEDALGREHGAIFAMSL